uniref:G-protein coupled receptors family 3 profile domain-containing protein n=1 Tax=Denticeps clupeoides TaxID=299321 RepID=A0AAY4DR30_9TELE
MTPLLVLPSLLCHVLLSAATVCVLWGDFELPVFMNNGDFTIGGIFPMHYRVEMPHTDYKLQPMSAQCKGFDPRAFRWAQAMRLAVEEINNRTDLLPNHMLGYKIYDSCSTPITAQKAVLQVLNGQETAHGAMCSGISYFSTCSCLSNRAKYPTFFRVVPNDDYQVKAIARLLKHFGWKWIGVVTEDHDYGRFALQGLKRELENTDICLAYHEMIPKDYSVEKVLKILDVMRTSSAKVIVVFSVEGEFYPFLKEFMNQNITGIQWIASEAWVTASVLAESYPLLDGTIGFAIRKGRIPRLRDYLLTVDPWRYPSNPMVHELWEALYGCSTSPASGSSQLPTCTGNETIRDQYSSYMNTSSPRVTYNVYKAVYAIAHSLHGLINCKPGKGPFQNSSYSVDCISCPDDFWSNLNGTQCIPKVVEFLSHDAMGMTLTVIAVAGACLTLLVLAVFFHFRNTPIVRLNNSELSFFILLSLTLCFLCALVFIGEPTSWSCMLRHTAFSITFSLCISCILGKTLVVLGAFTATRPGNDLMKWLGPRQQRVIIFSCTLVQVVICAAWLISAPPFPLRNTQYQRSKIILECSEGSELAFWCVLGYIGLLACLCFVLAFLARKLPGNFNEAKYITFSMLIFCAVWLAFIPAYVSSPGKFTVAVEIFAILASAFGLLFCLFAPKCYIILLKPDKNTKLNLIGKVTK